MKYQITNRCKCGDFVLLVGGEVTHGDQGLPQLLVLGLQRLRTNYRIIAGLK